MILAITRPVSPSIDRCELSHLERVPIDRARADVQHAAYVACLEDLGCRIERLAREPELPDSVFVEDCAVVVNELALLMRPGAESRRAELPSVAAALASYRELARIEAPGTIDGGDVLVAGRHVYVGATARTNRAGYEQLESALAPHGYEVQSVAVRGCLHLKSAVTAVSADTLLINPEFVSPDVFAGFELVEVDPREPAAANALCVGDALVVAAAYPETATRLEERGFAPRRVEADELAKAEGALTCCSLLLTV